MHWLISAYWFLLQAATPLQKLLENATEQVEHQRGILARINPRYIQKFVVPCSEHAEHIAKQSLYLAEYVIIMNLKIEKNTMLLFFKENSECFKNFLFALLLTLLLF